MAYSPATTAQKFDRDGFLIARNLFSDMEAKVWKEECRHILANLTEQAQERNELRPRFWQTGVYVGLSIKSAVFRDLHRDARLLDLLEPMVGPHIEFWSDKVVFKGEGTDFGTPWHQDWPYWKGCHKVSVWIALDDVDTSNGCLKLLPGSHQKAAVHDSHIVDGEGFGHRIDPDKIDESQVVAAPVRAGSAVVFHDLTFHASYPNVSGRDRWAAVLTYKDPRADDLTYPDMIAAEVVRERSSIESE